MSFRPSFLPSFLPSYLNVDPPAMQFKGSRSHLAFSIIVWASHSCTGPHIACNHGWKWAPPIVWGLCCNKAVAGSVYHFGSVFRLSSGSKPVCDWQNTALQRQVPALVWGRLLIAYGVALWLSGLTFLCKWLYRLKRVSWLPLAKACTPIYGYTTRVFHGCL